ncbi:DUF6378 domain-containing protein [Rhodoligotrophos defluvii]|uniref:DUF6378 domain-containing protein n=1 Tax=Rhodoligotrophos defluvii TaxID=2561934 RepID=UPI0019614C27|nr:DUF6378 domain-containing protein [Rhodoligotrophos defluvii]
MDRTETLERAKAAVCDRPGVYGAPENNFNRIARLWTAHLLNAYAPDSSSQLLIPHLRAADVAVMMGLVKVARLEDKPDHADSWVDLAGYAACGAEVTYATGAPDVSEMSQTSGETSQRRGLKVGDVVRLHSAPRHFWKLQDRLDELAKIVAVDERGSTVRLSFEGDIDDRENDLWAPMHCVDLVTRDQAEDCFNTEIDLQAFLRSVKDFGPLCRAVEALNRGASYLK